VFTTAMIVMPPEDKWSQIQEVRERHDKAFQRWMPHINLLYPFLPEDQFSYAVSKATRGLRTMKPFGLRFADFSYFEHGRSNTLYFKPETDPPRALQDLQSLLEALFPQCTDLSNRSSSGFTPHLTLGQFVGKIAVERQCELFRKSFTPVDMHVTHLHLISRSGNDPFVIKYSIPLGQDDDSLSIANTVPQALTQHTTESTMMEVDDIVDEDLKAVVSRLMKWLSELNQQKKLPKTKRAFLSASKSICCVKYKCCQLDKVYSTLQSEGYFSVGKDDKITYLKPPSHLLRGKNFGRISDEEWALERCREWVHADNNAPGTVSALRNSLDQLLVKRTDLDQDVVLNYLESKGVIKVDNQDNMLYTVH